MLRLTPLIRIALGLVALTCSILILIDMLGIVPTPRDQLLESRIRFCEALGAQATAALSKGDMAQIRAVLSTAVARNDDLISAALRDRRGRLLISKGEHDRLWDPPAEAGSSATHIRIPMLRDGRAWAILEMRFTGDGPEGYLASLWRRPALRLLLSVAVFGFIGYFVYMSRTLRHLDPSAVVPARVQLALDVMAEGVLVLDESEQIVLCNAAFSVQTGSKRELLLGTQASAFPWRRRDGTDATLPWVEAIREARSTTGTLLVLERSGDEHRVFQVNSAPVLDGWGRAKGAIATFDDVTELERRTRELEETLAELAKSQDEARVQNEELKLLARRDPLTGVSNRRHFLEALDRAFADAKLIGGKLAVVMADIDNFKKVNDQHGHATGDDVIRRVAKALGGSIRADDAVCRWGGEEFCLLFSGLDAETAATVADRIRRQVASPGFASVPVTASFGVSSIAFGATRVDELIGQADVALYEAKETGRNRVVRWDELDDSDTPEA